MRSWGGHYASVSTFGAGATVSHAARQRIRATRAAGRARDAGFTLLELLIVLGILPLVIGGIAVAMVASFQNEGAVTARLADSHDAQITSAYFVRDVQAASLISTSTTAPVCPTPTTRSQLLGLRWSSRGTTSSVTYSLSTNTSSPYLMRSYCAGAAAPVTTIVSNQSFTGLGPPTASNGCAGSSTCATSGSHTGVTVTVRCQDGGTACANAGLIATYPSSGSPGISRVVITITEYPSEFQYSLTAAPRNQASQILLPPGSAGPPLVLLGSTAPDLSCQNKSGVTVNGAVAVDSSQNSSISFGPVSSGLTATQVYTEPPASSPVTPPSDYGGPVVEGPAFPDPYAGLPDPTSSAVYTGTSIVGPGEYTNPAGVTVQSAVNLAPGNYIFEYGLSLSGNSSVSLTGSGVLLFIGIPNAPADVVQTAAYQVSGSASINLTAPTTGPFQGISVFQSRSDPTPMSISGNGASNTYGGVIYAPSASVSSNGNGSVATGSIVATSLGCVGNGGISVGFAVISSAPQLSPIQSGDLDADTVSVIGSPGLGAPEGSITFYVCGPSVAPGSCTSASWQQVGAPVPLTIGASDTSTATSQTMAYAAPGTWCFVATYNPNGHPNYGASSDTSTDGCFVVKGPGAAFTWPGTAKYSKNGWNADPCTPSGALCGSVSDTAGGTITTVEYQIANAANQCWNGTTWTATCAWLPVTTFTQSAWSVSWAYANFAAATSYTLKVQTSDSLGLASTSTRSFSTS